MEKLLNHPMADEFFDNFPVANTQIGYKTDIILFFEFTSETLGENLALEEITPSVIVKYRNFLSDNNYAPKSINRKLSGLASFFDFLIEKELIIINPVKSIRRPKQVVQQETNDLSDTEVLQLFQHMDQLKTPSAYLHRAVIYLLFSTGIRVKELINLKIKDFKIIKEHWTLNIHAKGGKRLTKLVPQLCVEKIMEYLEWAKSHGHDNHPENWLIRPTRNPTPPHNLDRPMNPKSINYIIKKYAKMISIDRTISAHSARATYIGSALENGADIYTVGQDVGHSSVKTTEEYNKRRQKLENSPAQILGYLNSGNKESSDS
jgi:integrase/recombinase XerD